MSMITKLRLHKVEGLKILLVVITAGLFVFAASTLVQQNRQAERSVANHTQTLNEIQQAVTQLKTNNQVNHDTTIKYIQCVVQSLTVNNPQVGFNACLAVSGVK